VPFISDGFILRENLLSIRSCYRMGERGSEMNLKTFWPNLFTEDLIPIKPEFPAQGNSIPTTNYICMLSYS
jgi:hypothetical protein